MMAPIIGESYGYLYIISNGLSQYKIGITNDVDKRINSLQHANPEPLRVVFSKRYKAVQKVEGIVHKRLSEFGMRIRGEWFSLNAGELKEIKKQLKEFPEDGYFTVYLGVIPTNGQQEDE